MSIVQKSKYMKGWLVKKLAPTLFPMELVATTAPPFYFFPPKPLNDNTRNYEGCSDRSLYHNKSSQSIA